MDRPCKLHIAPTVIALGFVAFFSGFGQDIITPILPGFLIALGASRATIGLMDGLLNGSTALFRLVSGLLSDRTRKRKAFVFVGYVISSVARPLLAVTGSVAVIGGLRTLDGVGKGMKDAPRDALIAASSNGRTGRAFGFSRLVDTAGSVFGPAVAALILFLLLPTLATYRFIFALAAIPGAIALAIIFFGVTEREPVTPKKMIRTRRPLPKIFWLFLAGSVIASLTRVNDALVLTRASSLGVPEVWIPILFAGFTLLYALCSYPIGVWSDKVGKLPMIVAGWFVLAGVEFWFSASHTILSALPAFACYGLFYALTEGSGRAIIGDLVPDESRGTAYALFYFTTGLALIAGGWGIGRVWDAWSPSASFAIAAGGSLVAALVILLATRR
ncbi:MAG: MFS transporter, partial [Patescibacteria group bacterium]